MGRCLFWDAMGRGPIEFRQLKLRRCGEAAVPLPDHAAFQGRRLEDKFAPKAVERVPWHCAHAETR